jgi:hypothetical protein
MLKFLIGSKNINGIEGLPIYIHPKFGSNWSSGVGKG